MGNIGKFKSPGTVLILSIVTLGIYGFIWMGMMWQEMKNYTGKGLGGWSLLLIFVPVANIYIYIMIIIYYFTKPQEIGMERMKLGLPQGMSAVWGLLPFLLGPIGMWIWTYFVQQNLNEMWGVAAGNSPEMGQPVGQ